VNARDEKIAQVSRGAPDGGRPGGLRAIGLIAVAVGATGSIALMLRAGHPPLFLRILFFGWVLAPFVALVVADIASKRWSALTRATLHYMMLIVTLGSLAIYGGAVPTPAGSRPAALFLIVPLASLLLLAIVVPVAGLVSRSRARRSAGA
jgi:hypothetical protein